MKTQPTTSEPLPACAGSVTVYGLVLSRPDWPRETRTKWQESPDFTKALAKAKELGVTTKVESQIVSDGATTADNGGAGFGSQNYVHGDGERVRSPLDVLPERLPGNVVPFVRQAA